MIENYLNKELYISIFIIVLRFEWDHDSTIQSILLRDKKVISIIQQKKNNILSDKFSIFGCSKKISTRKFNLRRIIHSSCVKNRI